MIAFPLTCVLIVLDVVVWLVGFLPLPDRARGPLGMTEAVTTLLLIVASGAVFISMASVFVARQENFATHVGRLPASPRRRAFTRAGVVPLIGVIVGLVSRLPLTKSAKAPLEVTAGVIALLLVVPILISMDLPGLIVARSKKTR